MVEQKFKKITSKTDFEQVRKHHDIKLGGNMLRAVLFINFLDFFVII